LVIVLACLLFGEPITWKLILGGTFVVTGAIILAIP
jgi:drug/metabolite transporter (DMT)-like permease